MAILTLSDVVPLFGRTGVWCAVFTFVMCYIAKYEWFDFCPGTFVGCFSAFAAGGNWKLLIVSLILGAFLGYGCDRGGDWLYQTAQKGWRKQHDE